jgi:hypothetical protein
MTTRKKVAIRLPDGSTVEAVDAGDVDLDEENEVRPAELAEEVLEAAGRPLPEPLRGAGRPSLDGGTGHSPQVAFRISKATRERAEQMAKSRGITVSQLAREALERELAS